MPIPAGEEDEERRNSWKGVFRSSIRPDILATNVNKSGDVFVLKRAMEAAQLTKNNLGTFLIDLDCDDVISKNPYRIPATMGACIVPDRPAGEPMAIGLAPIPDLYRPATMVNSNGRRLLDESKDEEFEEAHSYYALDPLYYTRHVYDRILNREDWVNEP